MPDSAGFPTLEIYCCKTKAYVFHKRTIIAGITFRLNHYTIGLVDINHMNRFSGFYVFSICVNLQHMTEHILFLTGKLAEKRLRRVLEAMQPVEFTWEVREIGVSVAALMTARMLGRRLHDVDGVDRIVVPGLCQGDLQSLSESLGAPVQRGPVDVKDLPVFFGREAEPASLDKHSVGIFAEIVEAPQLGIDEILARAARYKRDGADVIDVGCLPDTPFPHLEEAVQALQGAGYKVSVDSLEDDELLRGAKAGADYLLSLHESSAWIAEETDAVPILIPEQHTDMPSLYRLIDKFMAQDKPFIADSILDPVHFGFTGSIIRYHALREDYPGIEIMMGTGNLTELTEADTSGINAMLCGIISELDINHVLATEVSPHACSVVRELDLARRIMYAAKQDEGLPKGVDGGLLTGHSRKPFPYDLDEIREVAAQVKDPSYRVEITPEGIHVYNRDGLVTGQDAFALFPALELLQEDAPHAFYMGVELARAGTALRLGKRYVQDEDLDWGVAVVPGTDEEQEARAKSAHALKDGDEYKAAGTTLQAKKRKVR